MKIAVNTRLLLSGKLEGIGWFTFETLKRITKAHPEHEFIFIFDRPFSKEFIFADNISAIVIGPPARHPILFYFWFEFSVPRLLKKINADIFLSPDGYLSLKTNTKSLAVIHDLNFEHYPLDLPNIVRKYYKYFFPRFARKAHRIATVSNFSKEDISSTYKIQKEKIDVVYNGVNTAYHPLSLLEQNNFREQATDGKEYFIFVGSLHPRKNIHRLFYAFDKFKKKEKTDVKLMIVGEKYWFNKEIHRSWQLLKHKDDVIFTGRMNGENLNSAIASALAMVFVPYFEGFGIPVLEAFACKTAVICSNASAMPEVAGNAAFMVDPFNIEDISNAMHKLHKDDELRSELTEKGSMQLKKFNWDKTAELLWKSIEKCSQS